MGQGAGRQPKLHMGFTVVTAPLEPVDLHRSNPGRRGSEIRWGETGQKGSANATDERLGSLHALQPLQGQPHA